MKVLRVFLIVLIPLFLSGCYTQLQYSQQMKKITDRDTGGEKYSWSGEENTGNVEEPQEEYGDENLPIYYKDYEYADRYEDCACSPYNQYNFYGSNYYGYNFSNLSLGLNYFYRWHRPYYFGHRYYPHFAFNFRWGWGNSYYYHRFYDPFYDPFYDYYWGYHPYSSYFGGYYFGNSGYYYGDRADRINRNVRYGPRSIGADRVGNDSRLRNRSSVSGRTDARVTSKPTVRSRSAVGNTRSRSSTDRNSGSTVRSRSRNDNGESSRSRSNDNPSRSRSRDNFQQQDEPYRVYIDRTDEDVRPVIIDADRYREMRLRTIKPNDISGNREMVSEQYLRDRLQPLQSNRVSIESRSTFLKRFTNFLKNNSSRIINSSSDWSSNNAFRSRSDSHSNRSSISRGSNDTRSRSSVTRSRSSSNDSRSRGSSSRSRSSGGSSGSERSRDN